MGATVDRPFMLLSTGTNGLFAVSTGLSQLLDGVILRVMITSFARLGLVNALFALAYRFALANRLRLANDFPLTGSFCLFDRFALTDRFDVFNISMAIYVSALGDMFTFADKQGLVVISVVRSDSRMCQITATKLIGWCATITGCHGINVFCWIRGESVGKTVIHHVNH